MVKVRFNFDSEDEDRYETYPVEKLKWTPKAPKKEEKEEVSDNDDEIVEE